MWMNTKGLQKNTRSRELELFGHGNFLLSELAFLPVHMRHNKQFTFSVTANSEWTQLQWHSKMTYYIESRPINSAQTRMTQHR